MTRRALPSARVTVYEDGECDRLLVQRAQERPGGGDVDSVGDEVGVLTGIGGTVRDLGETDSHGAVPVLTAPGVLEGLAGHAEEPGTRRRDVGGHIVEATPRDEHDLPDDVLGMGRMDAPAYETEEIDYAAS